MDPIKAWSLHMSRSVCFTMCFPLFVQDWYIHWTPSPHYFQQTNPSQRHKEAFLNSLTILHYSSLDHVGHDSFQNTCIRLQISSMVLQDDPNPQLHLSIFHGNLRKWKPIFINPKSTSIPFPILLQTSLSRTLLSVFPKYDKCVH